MEEIFSQVETIANEAANTIASPNWADILSACLSLAAVVVAGIVAWKQIEIAKRQNEISERQVEIADRQNKIALFEKKYEVYCELYKIISIGGQLNFLEPDSRFSSMREIEVIYGSNFTAGKNVNEQLITILTDIKRSEYIIKQSLFLFHCIDETDIDELINALMDCMIFLIKDQHLKIDIEDHDITGFIELCNEFSSKYLKRLEAELDLR